MSKAVRKQLATKAFRKSAPAVSFQPFYLGGNRKPKTSGMRCSMRMEGDADSEFDSMIKAKLDDTLASDLGFSVTTKPLTLDKVMGDKASADEDKLRLLAKAALPNGEKWMTVWTDEEGKWQFDLSSEKPFYHKRMDFVLAGTAVDLVELRRSGQHQFTLVANTTIEDFVPVGRDTGALWFKDRFEQMADEELDTMIGLFATDIPKELFKKFKVKVPDLVQESTKHGNMFRFLQDGSWHNADKAIKPNLGSFTVITKDAPYVQVVYFSLGRVRKGEELIVNFGDKTWDALLNLQLAGHARVVRAYHRRALALQALVNEHNVWVPDLQPMPDSMRKELIAYDPLFEQMTTTTDAGEVVPFGPGAPPDKGDMMLKAIAKGTPPPDMAESASFMEVPDAFARCGVVERQTNDTTGVPLLIKSAFQLCSATSDDARHWNHAAYGAKLRRFADGTADKYITIVEDKCQLSPINLFTPPSSTPYAAVAAKDIRRGHPFAQYAGKLVVGEDQLSPENCYLFELSAEQMRDRGYFCSDPSRMLFVDPEETGNEARFINDKWTPRGLPQRKPNCFVRLIFDNVTKQPMLFWFAQQDIKQGDELIGDYGQKYWRHVFKLLMRHLSEETVLLRHKIHHLESCLPEGSLPDGYQSFTNPGAREREGSTSEGAGSSTDPIEIAAPSVGEKRERVAAKRAVLPPAELRELRTIIGCPFTKPRVIPNDDEWYPATVSEIDMIEKSISLDYGMIDQRPVRRKVGFDSLYVDRYELR